MATVKRINTTYTIDAPEIIIDGNLTVLGAETIVSTTDLAISDNIIILNNGEEGAGVTKGSAGIIIDRGSAPNAEFGWNESTNKWVISPDGINFANISAFTGNLTGLAAVEDDPNPRLGGNLNTLSNEIFSSTNNVIVNDAFQLKTQPTPANVTQSSILYANTISGGTTGLYVVNDSITAGEELVTKTRAFGFSLIL